MIKISFASFLLLSCLQFVYAAYVYEERKICLSCNDVSNPQECKKFVEIQPYERCTTERLLINDAVVYRFDYESESACANHDHVRRRRAGQKGPKGFEISICHECCEDNLCNKGMCLTSEHNTTDLACLSGKEVGGLPHDTTIRYCLEGEMCYTGEVRHARPDVRNYGCLSNVTCDAIVSSQGCQKCCSEDGCNVHLCDMTVDPEELEPITTTPTPTVAVTTPFDDTMPINKDYSTHFPDCWGLLDQGGFTKTGLYYIYPAPSNSRVTVRCDMTTDGGGWTTVQRRYNGSEEFHRTMQEYEDGFGEITGEHWLGLNTLHDLTMPQGSVNLRVDLCAFTGEVGYAEYEGFMINDKSDNYRMRMGTYMDSSTILNALNYQNGHEFHASGDCADKYKGGWWFSKCFLTHLNGGGYGISGDAQGIQWTGFHGLSWVTLRSSEMKLRPISVTGDPSRQYTCPP